MLDIRPPAKIRGKVTFSSLKVIQTKTDYFLMSF